MVSLLADIGGTKTQLALVDENYQIVKRALKMNRDYLSFDSLLKEFLNSTGNLKHAVIAIAGPVERHKRCQMTNLPWLVDTDQLYDKGFKKAVLINDLEATAWGMVSPMLQTKLKFLKGASLDLSLPVAIVSPGTGLGEACILPGKPPVIVGTEGGHKTIAPFNALSADLIQRHWQQNNRPLSRENWFSGSGLPSLFQAMFPEAQPVSNETISRLALADASSVHAQCIDLFTQAIFAEAGDLVLQFVAWGGVIICGGIPPKIEPFFQKAENIAYLAKKSEYINRLEQVPIAMCHEPDAPLHGGIEFLRQMMC